MGAAAHESPWEPVGACGGAPAQSASSPPSPPRGRSLAAGPFLFSRVVTGSLVTGRRSPSLPSGGPLLPNLFAGLSLAADSGPLVALAALPSQRRRLACLLFSVI